jgi:hypothetical protein
MSNARVRAEKIEFMYLQPGDLYSEHGPEYWNKAMNHTFLGLELTVRSCMTLEDSNADESVGEYVYKITIERLDEEGQLMPDEIPVLDPSTPPGMRRRT